jgi:hypothetical protein
LYRALERTDIELPIVVCSTTDMRTMFLQRIDPCAERDELSLTNALIDIEDP